MQAGICGRRSNAPCLRRRRSAIERRVFRKRSQPAAVTRGARATLGCFSRRAEFAMLARGNAEGDNDRRSARTADDALGCQEYEQLFGAPISQIKSRPLNRRVGVKRRLAPGWQPIGNRCRQFALDRITALMRLIPEKGHGHQLPSWRLPGREESISEMVVSQKICAHRPGIFGDAPTRRGTIFIFATNFYPLEEGLAQRASGWTRHFSQVVQDAQL
jgi:hypothetical protein